VCSEKNGLKGRALYRFLVRRRDAVESDSRVAPTSHGGETPGGSGKDQTSFMPRGRSPSHNKTCLDQEGTRRSSKHHSGTTKEKV
jgi:hypothetical protein